MDISHGQQIDDDDNVNIPQLMVTFSEDELINDTYGDIQHLPITPYPIDYFLDHAILAMRNVDVQNTNEKILLKMQGHEIILHSADSLESDGGSVNDDVPKEFLRTINPALLLLLQLKVKIGCPLMLLWNLDPDKGLCHGMRMILLYAYPCILEVIIISGDHRGEKAFVPRITLKPSSSQYPFILK